MISKYKHHFLLYLVSGILLSSPLFAATKTQYQSADLKVVVASNPPQPLSAFYEARGFQKNMINIIKKQCFVSVFIKNTSKDFIWLDLSQWKFSNTDGEIKRLDRSYWKAKWQSMAIPLAHQSTFRWTLIPELLDFHPNEREGGNIVLPRLGKPFNITAQFSTGADRKGRPITVNFAPIECAVDP